MLFKRILKFYKNNSKTLHNFIFINVIYLFLRDTAVIIYFKDFYNEIGKVHYYFLKKESYRSLDLLWKPVLARTIVFFTFLILFVAPFFYNFKDIINEKQIKHYMRELIDYLFFEIIIKHDVIDSNDEKIKKEHQKNDEKLKRYLEKQYLTFFTYTIPIIIYFLLVSAFFVHVVDISYNM